MISDFLSFALENNEAKALSAAILGLVTAISPCPLATNITATAYISKDIENRNRVFVNGLVYTLGRAFSYFSLGLLLFFGSSKFKVAGFLNTYGEKILGPLLLLFGLFMLGVFLIPLKDSGIINRIASRMKFNGVLGPFFLGVLFALAFCPYSGVIFFGMLIPMSITSPQGLFLPLLFAIATGLPVILIAFLLAYSVSGIGRFYKRVKAFELWFRRFTAIIFILAGVYFILIYFLGVNIL